MHFSKSDTKIEHQKYFDKLYKDILRCREKKDLIHVFIGERMKISKRCF